MRHKLVVDQKFYLWAVAAFASAGILFSGCIGSDYGSAEPLSHVQPAHWPNNMADAADKIESRLKVLKGLPSAQSEFAELSDLISWAAEVAADTDLSEGDWIPIYEASERLRKELLARGDLSGLFDDVEQLVVLLRDAQHQVDLQRSSDLRGYPAWEPTPSDPSEQ